MHGKDVGVTQNLLRDSKYGNFKPGVTDNVYGETTAGAVRRAKFWLGYPSTEVKAASGLVIGDRLRNLLSGKKSLPATFALRRKLRLRAAGPKPLRVRMLAEAKKHIGTKESPPGSNRVKFSAWYGIVGAWCAMFVSYCGVVCGSKTFKKGQFYAYTPFMVRDARLGVNGMSLISPQDVKPGHIIMFDWQSGGMKGNMYNTDHTGFYDKPLGGGKFATVEGNTAVGADSDGGEVMPR